MKEVVMNIGIWNIRGCGGGEGGKSLVVRKFVKEKKFSNGRFSRNRVFKYYLLKSEKFIGELGLYGIVFFCR